jgi:gliding motility-associated-like protein
MKKFKAITTLLVLLGFQSQVKADHFFGADISYRLLDSNTAKYRFTVTLYRSCSGITFFINTNLSVRKAGFKAEVPMSLVSKQEVTPQCQPPDVPVKPATNCPGQTPMLANGTKGVERWIYTVDYTFGKNSGWVFVGYQECCRNLEITTGQTWQNAWVQAALNTNYLNNSTIFRSPPIPYWCRMRLNTYNHGAVDTFDSRYITINNKQVIRDSLAYVLICPFLNEAANPNDAALLKNPCCTWAGGLSPTNFMYTVNGINFDAKTGQYSCIPDRVQDAVMAIAVEEWRAIPNGSGGYTRVKVGYVCRDVQITVREACPDIYAPGVVEDSLVSANKIAFDKVDICGKGKTRVTFKLVGAPNQNLLTKVIEVPKSDALVNFKYVENKVRMNFTDTIFGTITFDSAVGVGTERFLLEYYYCDVIGNKISRFYNLTLNFRTAVRVKDRLLYYCIGGKPVKASVNGATKYSWTPKTGISWANSSDSSEVNLEPTSSTTYVVKGIDGIDSTQSCTIIDSLRVIVIPRFNYTLAPKLTDLCLHDTVQVSLVTQISDTPYTYKWIDPVSFGSIYNPAANKISTSIASPKIIALKSGTYPVEITSRFNCILTDSIRINMNGVRPVASGLSNRKLLCPGDTTMLSINVIPKTCGPSIYTCASPDVIRDVTAGVSSVYPTGLNPHYPHPLNTTGAAQGATTRIIYTRAELINAGVRPGIIKSIAFNLQTINITTIDRLEVRIGSTMSFDARTLNIPMFSIFGTQQKALIAGFSGARFPITNGFDWDGISNLVVETHCRNTTSATTPNIIRTMGTVSGNQIATKLATAVGQDAENSNNAYIGSGGTSAKPQLQVEFCTVDSTPTNLLNAIWTPSNLITNVSNPRAIGRVTQKDSVFIATVGTSLCFDTALVRLNIDQNFKVKINSGKRVYCVSGSSTANISLSATVTGGVGTTINWQMVSSTTGNHGMPTPPQTTNTLLINPGTGQHTYVISAVNGPCNATDTVVITVNNNIPVSLKIDSSLCTASNGKIKAILPIGSTADSFNFIWRKGPLPGTLITGAIRDSIINLAPDSFRVLISLKSDASCTGTSSGVLSAKMDTITSNVFTSGIRCKGQIADSVWAVVLSSTGSGNYKYTWSPGAIADSFYKIINRPEGIIVFTITDRVTGCMGRKTFNHNPPDTLTILLESIIPVKCKGENTGEIKVKGNGGTLNGGSYVYQWSGVNSQNLPIPNFNHLVGLYTDSLCVTVTDVNNCIATACFKVTEPIKSLTIDSIKRVNASTVGGSDGSATVFISGGTANFNYKWTRQNGTPVNGAAGTTIPTTNHATPPILNKQMYYVCVTDQNGCKACDSVMVLDIICNWKYALKLDSVKCYDSSTGKITIGAIDSQNYATTANYTYTLHQNSITNPSLAVITKSNHYPIDTAIFQNLKSGFYLVRLQSNKGCDTVISSIDIPQNNAIQGITSSQMPSCFGTSDGKVCVSAVDKFTPFEYDFGSGYKLDSCDTTQVSGVNKIVRVRNALGCTVTWNYTVPTPDSISVLVLPVQTRCNGDTTKLPINIQVTSINPALLSNLGFINKPGTNADTLSNELRGMTGGVKNIIVNYNNIASGKRCTYPYQFTVTEPQPLVLSLVQADNPNCDYTFDGKFNVKLRTGERGNIPTGSQNYHYELIKNTSQINEIFTKDTNVIFDNLDSGTYTLRVTDFEGCTHSFIHSLNKPQPFSIGLDVPRDANCLEVNNGSMNVSRFTGGNPTVNYGFVWVIKDLLNGSIDTLDKLNYNAATANLLRGLAEYKVIVTDIRGCRAESPFIMLDTMYQLRITKVTVDSVQCFGLSNGSITINSIYPANKAPLPLAYDFSSDNGSQDRSLNFRTLAAGTFTYTVSDAVGCKATGASNVYEPTDILITSFGNNLKHPKCYGEASGSIKITVSGGQPPYSNIVWNSPPNEQYTDSAVALPAGLHTVRLIDAKGCPKIQSFPLIQPNPFTARAVRVKQISCYKAADGEIDIETTGGFSNLSYSWSHGLENKTKQVNLKPALQPNPYRLTITDANLCKAYVEQEIREPKELTIDDVNLEHVSCPKYSNGVIVINANGGTPKLGSSYDYSIDGGLHYFSTSKFTGLSGKEYNVTVRDSNGCVASRKYTINEPEELLITAKKDASAPDTLTMGNEVSLYFDTFSMNGIIPATRSVNWTPSIGLSCTDCKQPKASPYATTRYEVEVTYHKDCKARSKINVPVFDPLDFFVPSAFSPGNNDGLNDKLNVFGNGIKKFSLVIFNRWGEKVYEANHLSQGWDGNYKGEPQPSGVYSFSAEVEYLNGEKREKKGSITLVR